MASNYVLLLLACIVLSMSPTVTALVINVSFDTGNDTLCLPCKTINGAFAQRALASGDTIVVAPIKGGGVYNMQQTVLVTQSITLQGAAGVNISCTGLSNCFTMKTLTRAFVGDGDTFSLDGVTIQGCTGPAIYANTGTVQITNCNFISNQNALQLEAAATVNITQSSFSLHSGPVISALTGRTLTIMSSNFMFNTGGIVVNTTAATVIQNCNFISNGMILSKTSDGGLTIQDSTISDSYFDAGSGNAAVIVQNANGIQLTNMTFTRNSVHTGITPYAIALYIADSTDISISECTFKDNLGLSGPIVSLLGVLSGTTILNNVEFSGNVANSSALSIDTTDATVNITNSHFSNNQALDQHSGGAIVASGTTLLLNIHNCSFFSNSANLGGAIYMEANLTLSYSTFFNNSARAGGGALIFFPGNGILTGNNFTNCSTQSNNGGAILFSGNYFSDDSSFYENNSATECGAISLVNSGNITRSTFFSNSANSGGAICAFSLSDTYVANCTFSKNAALATGGAIYAFNSDSATVHLDGCTLSYNTASQGGAFGTDTSDTANLNAHNCTFTGNSASSGGAVEAVGSVSCSNCFFTSNTATQNGGAIDAHGSGTLDSCTFQGNTAQQGGGITFFGANGNTRDLNSVNAQIFTLSISQSSFSSNTASQKGGALLAQSSNSINLGNVIFYNNSANMNGGAIAAYSALTSSNCIFQENYGAFLGGAVFTSATGTTYVNSKFSQNRATSGGAFYAENSAVNFASCGLANNTATQGGAIYISLSTFSSNSDLIEGNSATEGGGIYATGSNSSVTGSTIQNNTAQNLGAGIYVDSYMKITNATIVQNVANTMAGDGIYIQASESKNLEISNTVLSNLSPFSFCCGGEVKSNVSGEICSYPPCSAGCGTLTTGSACECAEIPSAPCSCTSHFVGDYCNIIDPCFNNSACPGGCVTDANYEISLCCTSGFVLGNNTCLDIDECATKNSCAANALCYNTKGSYTCTCPPPLTGNATLNCTACTNNSCFPGVLCDTIGSSFSCGSCPGGYNGTAVGIYGCQDIDECTTYLNGNCDLHTNCTNTIGSFQCSACPAFFSGLGNETCTALCGDGICDSKIGEQCVICPLDCPAPCGLCGDNNCDVSAGETCENCSADCGTCKATACPSDCSKHGTCNNGICACAGNSGGPSCNSVNHNFALSVSAAHPGFTITTNNSNDQVTFTVSFKEIREIDQSSNVISFFNLTNFNFTFTQFINANNYSVTNNSACDLSFYVHTSGGANNKQYSTNVTLPNLATIEIMIWKLESATLVTFANTSTNFAANTVKSAVQIRNWPFKQARNSIVLVLDSINDSEDTPCVRKSEDENGNLKWLTLNVDGLSLYSQFLDVMIVDGVLRKILYSRENDNSISMNIPHFWVNAVLDPTFSVLLEESNCHTSRKFVKIISIVIPVVFVVAILLIVFVIYLPRIRSYFFAKRTSRRLSKAPVMSSDERELDKIKPPGVHSYDANAIRL